MIHVFLSWPVAIWYLTNDCVRQIFPVLHECVVYFLCGFLSGQVQIVHYCYKIEHCVPNVVCNSCLFFKGHKLMLFQS